MIPGRKATPLGAMRYITILAAGPMVTLSIACAQVAPTPLEATLRLQDSTAVGHDVSVRFVGYSDNRCPSDVLCFAAGHATVLLQVTAPSGPPRYVAMRWPVAELNSQLSDTAFGLRFCFIALDPHPQAKRPVNPASYTVRFKVAAEHELAGCKDGA
jgi:hypothetical protein